MRCYENCITTSLLSFLPPNSFSLLYSLFFSRHIQHESAVSSCSRKNSRIHRAFKILQKEIVQKKKQWGVHILLSFWFRGAMPCANKARRAYNIMFSWPGKVTLPKIKRLHAGPARVCAIWRSVWVCVHQGQGRRVYPLFSHIIYINYTAILRLRSLHIRDCLSDCLMWIYIQRCITTSTSALLRVNCLDAIFYFFFPFQFFLTICKRYRNPHWKKRGKSWGDIYKTRNLIPRRPEREKHSRERIWQNASTVCNTEWMWSRSPWNTKQTQLSRVLRHVLLSRISHTQFLFTRALLCAKDHCLYIYIYLLYCSLACGSEQILRY